MKSFVFLVATIGIGTAALSSGTAKESAPEKPTIDRAADGGITVLADVVSSAPGTWSLQLSALLTPSLS